MTTASAPSSPRWRRWLLEGLIFIAVFMTFQAWQLRDAARGPAPDIHGQRLDGSPFDLSRWRAEHPEQATLLYLWAEWCPVCKTTAGNVTAIAADWPVTSIAVSSGDDAAVSQFMRDRGYAWPTLNDPQGTLIQPYHLPGTPAFVIIAPDGHIRFVAMGYTSELGLRLRLWLASTYNQ